MHIYSTTNVVRTWLCEGHHGEGNAGSERQRSERLCTYLRDSRQSKHVLRKHQKDKTWKEGGNDVNLYLWEIGSAAGYQKAQSAEYNIR